MLCRVVLLLLLVCWCALVGAQVCPSPSTQSVKSCSATLVSSNAATGGSAVLLLGFSYCAPSASGYGTGPLVGVSGGTLTINHGNAAGDMSTVTVSALSGSITTGAPGSLTASSATPARAVVPASQAPILSFASAAVGVAESEAASLTISSGETVALSSHEPDVTTAGVTISLSVLPADLQAFTAKHIACS